MRAYREDTPVRQQRRGVYAIVAGIAVLVLATLVYLGLRDTAEPAPEAPLPVVRDTETVALPEDNAAAESPGAQGSPATANFAERELAPPRTVLGVGEAPVVERQNEETFVINGELLEKLEAEAEATTE